MSFNDVSYMVPPIQAGTDGKLSGPGGTQLTDSVVTDASSPAAELESAGATNGEALIYNSSSGKWEPGSAGGSLEVTDGTHTVSGAMEIDFTSGATVMASGSTAQVAISGGSSLTVTDGTNTETGISTLEVTSPGATVSSPSSGEAQVTITSKEAVNTVGTGGSAQTIPDPWSSPFYTLTDLTLTSATCTLTFPTAAAGKSFTIMLRQDGTGGRLVSWPGSGAIVWMSGGGTAVLSTAANAVDIVTFVCTDGTHWLGAFTPGYSVTAGGDDQWIGHVNCYSTFPNTTVGTWGAGLWHDALRVHGAVARGFVLPLGNAWDTVSCENPSVIAE